MPSNETAKIKWARRSSLLCIAIALSVFAATIILNLSTQPTLRLAKGVYKLEVVESRGAKERGLSGRTSLPRQNGMLFIYTSDEKRCFWMKEMQFSIDIIWTDASKKITHIEPSISPNSYPRTFCAEGQHIIELNAGEASRNFLQKGQQLTF